MKTFFPYSFRGEQQKKKGFQKIACFPETGPLLGNTKPRYDNDMTEQKEKNHLILRSGRKFNLKKFKFQYNNREMQSLSLTTSFLKFLSVLSGWIRNTESAETPQRTNSRRYVLKEKHKKRKRRKKLLILISYSCYVFL